MKRNNYPTLIALAMTAILLIAVIFIFFNIKKRNVDTEELLKTEEEKLENATYDITYVKPKNVFEAIRDDEFLIIDTRDPQEFAKSHIESSINVPLDNLVKTNSTLDKNKTLLVIEKDGTLKGKEMTNTLKDAGFKVNYLHGGLYLYLGMGYNLVSSGDKTSIEDRAKVSLLELEDLGARLLDGERFIYLDVRNTTDFEKDHFQNAINVPLERLEKDKNQIPIGKLLIIDEDPIRSFKAAVRLHDMNVLTAYYLINTYSEFKDSVKNRTLLAEK
jgi:rhodanese-related sulfurtransferase